MVINSAMLDKLKRETYFLVFNSITFFVRMSQLFYAALSALKSFFSQSLTSIRISCPLDESLHLDLVPVTLKGFLKI